MKAVVTRPYQRPYADPIAVTAGTLVTPDFDKQTDIAGWVWCTAAGGRSGWTPRAWLEQIDGGWKITRDFNALELTVEVGDRLEVLEEESGFYLARSAGGQTGWVPCENVAPAEAGKND